MAFFGGGGEERTGDGTDEQMKAKLEVDNGLSNGEISLNSPRQIKDLSHNELEDVVHIDVVCCT